MLTSVRARIRLLPVTLVAVTALAGLKAVDLWQGGRFLGAPIASAQTGNAQTGNTQKDAKAGAGAPTPLVPSKPGAASASKPDAAAKPETKKAEAAKPEAGKPEAGKAEAGHPQEKPTVRSAMPAPPKTTTAVLPRDTDSYTAAEVEVLQSLSRRREELDQREQGVAAREALLAAAEKRIEARINELKALETKLTALADKRSEEEEKRLRGLVKVYESMKPADAARIFQDLDMPVLLDVAERMREAKLGPILAQMNPERARAMTVELAGRRNPAETVPPKAEAGSPKDKPS